MIGASRNVVTFPDYCKKYCEEYILREISRLNLTGASTLQAVKVTRKTKNITASRALPVSGRFASGPDRGDIIRRAVDALLGAFDNLEFVVDVLGPYANSYRNLASILECPGVVLFRRDIDRVCHVSSWPKIAYERGLRPDQVEAMSSTGLSVGDFAGKAISLREPPISELTAQDLLESLDYRLIKKLQASDDGGVDLILEWLEAVPNIPKKPCPGKDTYKRLTYRQRYGRDRQYYVEADRRRRYHIKWEERINQRWRIMGAISVVGPFRDAIAAYMGVTTTTISAWCKSYRIDFRIPIPDISPPSLDLLGRFEWDGELTAEPKWIIRKRRVTCNGTRKVLAMGGSLSEAWDCLVPKQRNYARLELIDCCAGVVYRVPDHSPRPKVKAKSAIPKRVGYARSKTPYAISHSRFRHPKPGTPKWDATREHLVETVKEHGNWEWAAHTMGVSHQRFRCWLRHYKINLREILRGVKQ